MICLNLGGSTYCAVAVLHLMNEMKQSSLTSLLKHTQLERLKRWCALKQEAGFHGRANKEDDSCYTFWFCATLSVMAKCCLWDITNDHQLIT